MRRFDGARWPTRRSSPGGLLSMSPSASGAMSACAKERVAIAEALQARDAEAAELAVQRYVQRGKELVRKFGSPE
jgi:DNA-binding FadR family transcriptional regulator